MLQITLKATNNRDNGDYLILDIGGTLCKICVVKFRSSNLTIFCSSLQYSNDLIASLSQKLPKDFHISINDLKSISVTGGGAFKFSTELSKYFGHHRVIDEMSSIVKGAFFNMEHIEPELGSLIKYPIILANIGTGASFILVDENKTFKRIGGTNLAGGTFSGMSSLLQQTVSSEEISDLIKVGNKDNVDTLVRDIYGSAYKNIGLDGNIVAGSLDKVRNYSGKFLAADVCSSSAFMICNNLVHLLSLYVLVHNAMSVLISGSFPAIPSIKSIFEESMKAKLNVQSKILRHGGYLSCLGIVSDLLSNDI